MEGFMADLPCSAERALPKMHEHPEACQCDDCRVVRARRQWSEKWCRLTGRSDPASLSSDHTTQD